MKSHVIQHLYTKTTLILSIMTLSGTACADERDGWIHTGVGYVDFHESATLKMAGQNVQGGDAKASNNTTAIFELGYNFTNHLSASFTFGAPPTSKVSGAGSINGSGHLGSVKYAPAMLIGQYWFDGLEYFKPYVGTGVVYYAVLNANDAAIQKLDIDNGWGSVLQAGFEIPFTSKAGFFLDIKKVYISVDGSGNLPAAGGAPVTTTVRLNPVIIHSGISFKF